MCGSALAKGGRGRLRNDSLEGQFSLRSVLSALLGLLLPMPSHSAPPDSHAILVPNLGAHKGRGSYL